MNELLRSRSIVIQCPRRLSIDMICSAQEVSFPVKTEGKEDLLEVGSNFSFRSIPVREKFLLVVQKLLSCFSGVLLVRSYGEM